MKTLYIVLVSVFTLVSCSSVKTAEQQAKEDNQWKALQQMVADKTFELEAEWAYPFGSSQVNLFGNSNYFRFKGDTVATYLPYFGVRRNGPVYGNESGIVVDGPYSNLVIDTVDAYLPYFGVRRNGPVYGNESGIVVDGPYSNLVIDENPTKNEINIAFEIREKSESYDFNLVLFANKTADITVKSSQRDVIRYDAKIVKSTKPTQ